MPREVREQGDLEHQGDDDRDQGGDQRRVSAGSSDAPVGLDDGAVAVVPDGTTTPTRSSEEKSTNGSITARWEVSRRLLKTSVTRPIGMPAT